jgi:hypothetical protein
MLNEVYSSSTCGPCAPGNANYLAISGKKDRNTFATVKYQQYFPGTGDPYTTTETIGRLQYYGINSIPRMEIDGQWDGNAQSYTDAVYDNYGGKVANIEVEATYKVNFHTVTVDAKIIPYANMPQTSLKLRAAIVERTTTNNIKTNGETEFHNVVKKMLPDHNGTSIPGLVSGTNQTYNLSFTFPGDYRLAANGQTANIINLSTEHSVEQFSDLAVIVWVQDDANKTVLNSTNAKIIYNAGLHDNQSVVSVKNLYPNPAQDYMTLEFTNRISGHVTVEITNLVGQVMSTEYNGTLGEGDHKVAIRTNELSNGVYMMTVKTADGEATQKFIVAK